MSPRGRSRGCLGCDALVVGVGGFEEVDVLAVAKAGVADSAVGPVARETFAAAAGEGGGAQVRASERMVSGAVSTGGLGHG